MAVSKPKGSLLDEATRAFYCAALCALTGAELDFLVGGAYSFHCYTGIERHTKDFDIFVRPRDVERAMRVLSATGCHTELTFPHWLAKACCGDAWVDIIFSSGNGVADVDDDWFRHAVATDVLGYQVRLVPAEEMIWQKAFIMERERFDGADVAHLLHARARRLNWVRLLQRFGSHWRVLLSHIVLFEFIFPGERAAIPDWVTDELTRRLQSERVAVRNARRLCRGTLLSREQYLVDVEQRGYRDARLAPVGSMNPEDAAIWTAAIQDNGN